MENLYNYQIKQFLQTIFYKDYFVPASGHQLFDLFRSNLYNKL